MPQSRPPTIERRLARAASALLFLALPALAQQQRIELAVDNLRFEANTMHAIVRLTNGAPRAYASVTVHCAFLVKGRALDTGLDIVKNIGSGDTVYANVIGPSGAEASSIDEARCRVSDAR